MKRLTYDHTPPVPLRHPGAGLTLTLAGAWVLLYAFSLMLSGGFPTKGGPLAWGTPTLSVLIKMGANVPPLVRIGDTQRLITYAFLHASLLHVILNVWVWVGAARLLESVAGATRTWIVFFVAAVAGGAIHQVVSGGAVVGVGASGGVFGVVGALGLWAFLVSDPAAARIKRTVIVFLILSVLLILIPEVDALGHVAGLVAGVVTMAILGPGRASQSPGNRVRLVGILMMGATAWAGYQQAAHPASGRAAEAHVLITQLRELDGMGRPLYYRPDQATPERRAALTAKLDELRATRWHDAWDGREEYRALLDAWRPVASGHVPDPFVFKRALDIAEAAWRPYADRLRELAGLP